MTGVLAEVEAASAPRRDPDPTIRPGRTVLLLAVIVAVGAVARGYRLGVSRLSYDESFTAMAGRLPLRSLLDFLRVNDSHPPLDYLMRAPFARLGVSEFWFRTPSLALSVGALALFAWWVRDRGRVGVVATALLALNTFAVVHGRDARMYAGMEFIGVSAVVLASAWVARPRRRYAVAVGVLVLIGLLSHVSMFLAGFGLLVLAGRRTDRAAWEWRAGLVGGVVGWGVLWGSSFVTQAHGGHSSWIGPTTPASLVSAVGRLVTSVPPLYVPGLLLMAAGARMLSRRDREFFRLWACCFGAPVVAAAVAGFFVPVVLERTFAVVMWAPILAVAYFVDGLMSARPRVGIAVLAVLLGLSAWTTVDAIRTPTRPDVPLRRLAAVVEPGDIVVIHPAAKQAELTWSLGVRSGYQVQAVSDIGLPDAVAIRLGTSHHPSKIWVLDWWGYSARQLGQFDRCAPTWSRGAIRVLCLTPRA